MRTDDYDYALPDELIALYPPEKRDGGRLLVLDPGAGVNLHRGIRDLPVLLPPNALLIANDTRVFKARLYGVRPTGGKVEVLLVRPVETRDGGCRFEALIKANRPVRSGDRFDLGDVPARVISRGPRGEAVIELESSHEELRHHIQAHGQVPLPPYIRRSPVPEDDERYQTVYAESEGSVAAPTAGLHFTPELMADIRAAGVQVEFITLHVGPGTFRPIVAEDIAAHKMDREAFSIPENVVASVARAKAEGRPVIAVGTTTTRALEGAFVENGRLVSGEGFTTLFITPGFRFNVIDGLITNFHLPKSTLLLLVSALAGRERILGAYKEAIDMKYRFYSYGDAMLILPGIS